MSKDDKKTFGLFAFLGLIAAAFGFLAGILSAPKSGKEIRQDIKQAGADTEREAEKELKDLNVQLNKVIKEAKGKGADLGKKAGGELNKLVDKGEDTNAKVREIISAIHEGDAEDQDLKRAITNAKNALENLKDYLDK